MENRKNIYTKCGTELEECGEQYVCSECTKYRVVSKNNQEATDNQAVKSNIRTAKKLV